MNKTPQAQQDRLLDYLDGNLNEQEALRLEDDLRKNPALHAQYNDLRALHQALKQTGPEQPSKNFTQVLMSKLDQLPAPSGWTIRNGILLLAGVLVAVGIASLLVSGGVFDNATTTIDLNKVELPEKYIPQTLPSFNFSSKWMVNTIIVLNLALAWVVLDRLILKPFFQRRGRGLKFEV
jgi:hypothetical protein